MSIDSIVFGDANLTSLSYILAISTLNLLPTFLILKLKMHKAHFFAVLVLDAYLIAQAMFVKDNILLIITAIYFFVICIIYYKLNKHSKFWLQVRVQPRAVLLLG